MADFKWNFEKFGIEDKHKTIIIMVGLLNL